MATKLDDLFTSGGRLVMGSLTERNDKDYEGNLIPEDKRGLFIGVAVPKTNPEVMPLINQLWQMAATDYAQAPLVMAQINQGLDAKDFSWKIQDGDVPTYDKKTGKPRETPDYLKGKFIFKFQTLFDLDACDTQGNQLSCADIKRGDYVDVKFNASVNNKVDDNAGIYLNPVAICRTGYGEAISGKVSAVDAFAGRQHVIPEGAHQSPFGAGAPNQVMPGAGAPAAGGMPQGMMANAGTVAPVANGMPMTPSSGIEGNSAPAPAPTAPAGTMPGMPGAAPTTAYPSNVQPHTTILQGPQGGGMPGMGQ